MSDPPYISVILPVRNEAQSLPALLSSLLCQDYPHNAFEIIVADGRSTDSTRDVVTSFASQSTIAIVLADNPGIRSGPGRNAGLTIARGEYIIFIDGHCSIPSVHLLRDTVAIFAQTNADCLCRPQPLLAPVRSEFGAAVAAARASLLGHGRDSLIYDMTATGLVDPASSGASYRRAVFSTVGVYDERFDACEDVELNIRVRKSGMQAYTDPRLAVYYEPRLSPRPLMKQMVRYGRGRIRLMQKHRDCITAAQIAPALLVAWIAAAIVVSLFPVASFVRLLLLAPVLAYALAVLVSSVGLAMKHRPGFFIRGMLIYCIIHTGLGLGLWAETLARMRAWAQWRSGLGGQGITEC
jgi:glycosyltransferase involved in cell wall biosynthesis